MNINIKTTKPVKCYCYSIKTDNNNTSSKTYDKPTQSLQIYKLSLYILMAEGTEELL